MNDFWLSVFSPWISMVNFFKGLHVVWKVVIILILVGLVWWAITGRPNNKREKK